MIDAPLRSKLCESSMTLLPDPAKIVAISRAASRRRSSRKPLFLRSASPTSSALFASPCALTMIDWSNVRLEGQTNPQASPVFPESLDQLETQHGMPFVERPKKTYLHVAQVIIHVKNTCLASTACVNSGEKATWVIDTSSRTRLNFRARSVKFSRTSRDTCVVVRKGAPDIG